MICKNLLIKTLKNFVKNVDKAPNKRVYIELLDVYRDNKRDIIRAFEMDIKIFHNADAGLGYSPMWENDEGFKSKFSNVKNLSPTDIQELINESFLSGTGRRNPLMLIDFNKDTIEKIFDQACVDLKNNIKYSGGFRIIKHKPLTEYLFGHAYLSKMAIHWRDGYICALCGKRNSFKDEINVDHIIPKSKYQSSHPWNLQSTCENCNIEKSARLLDNIPVYLKGAKYRSQNFFNESWKVFEIYRLLTIIYKTSNNPLTINKGWEFRIDFDQKFISTIIEMPNKWDRISKLIENWD